MDIKGLSPKMEYFKIYWSVNPIVPVKGCCRLGKVAFMMSATRWKKNNQTTVGFAVSSPLLVQFPPVVNCRFQFSYLFMIRFASGHGHLRCLMERLTRTMRGQKWNQSIRIHLGMFRQGRLQIFN